jgi:hypothetical protein
MAGETVLLFICWAHRRKEASRVSKEAVLSLAGLPRNRQPAHAHSGYTARRSITLGA